jgi:hypothetical protein
MGLSGEHQVPPPKEEGEICFSSTCPVELGAQAGTAKLLSPCTQGPPWGTISSPSPNPAGVQREGRSEIRSPMEPLQGQDCRSRARRGPSEISIPWDPSPGPAGSMGCRRERQRIPKPSGARESRARKGSVETAVSRGPSPWPAGSTGCRRLRMRYESKGVEALTCTHLGCSGSALYSELSSK